MSDLSWQQMQVAATQLNMSNVFVLVNNEVYIRVGGLLGNPVTALTATGVVETLFDLREIASKAQDNFNQGKQIGERLAAFPPSTGGSPVSNVVLQVGTIYVRRPLATTGILGVVN